jgi:hypothetical protein
MTERTDLHEHLGAPGVDLGWGSLEQWKALQEPFSEDAIEHRPQPILSQKDDPEQGSDYCQQGRQVKTKWGSKPVSADGFFCGNRHRWSVHLTYVGHAGLTMRLNDVCTPAGWDWEPVAVDEHGFPMLWNGSLWIHLTVLGVRKKGVGDAEGRTGPSAIKETIGDAMRNAAMRFGIATYLWGKSDKAKSLAGVVEPEPAPRQQQRPASEPQAERPVTAPGPDAKERAITRATQASLAVWPRKEGETQKNRRDHLKTILTERGWDDTLGSWLRLAREYGEGTSNDEQQPGAPV